MSSKLLWLAILSSFICTAQTKRFYYSVAFKPDGINTSKDLIILDINPEGTFFYSNEYVYTDSLNNLSANSKFKFARPKFKNIVKWYKKDHSFDFIHRLSMNYYLYTSKKTLTWKLEDNVKKIGSYNTQKATTHYGGRNWIAWFSTEIPLPYGPYIFYGLPGMVLEVYDTEYNYHFTFIGNKNYDLTMNSEKMLDRYLGLNKFVIPEKDWIKIKLNYYNNPIPEYKAGDAIVVKDDGTLYNHQDYRNMEKNIRTYIKRYNNPVEADQKVNYK